MESDKAKSILEKIKREHIAPEPRWKLNLKSYIFWVFVFFALILGGISFSLIIFNFLDFGPGVFHYFGLGRIIGTFLLTAPILWIGLFLVAFFSGLLIFRKTKKGYRYGVFFVGSLGVLIISLLGVGMHLANIGEKVGKGLTRSFPCQRNLAFPIEGRWSNPEEKMLGGEVREVAPEVFMLLDFSDEIWEVHYSSVTEMRPKKELAPGVWVGVVGEKTAEKKFQAEFIHSLPSRGQKGGCCSGVCSQKNAR